MRTLVTGAGGFIGRATVAELLAAGHAVVTLSRRTAPPFPDLPHRVAAVESDAAIDAARDADVIIHLAGFADASGSWADPNGYFRVNALGTAQLVEGARRAGAAFVFASSQRVYQPQWAPVAEDAPTVPTDPYGASKLVAEAWVGLYHRSYGVKTLVVRPFSVYGPGQRAGTGTSGVVAIFVREALAGRPLRVFGDQRRDFIAVSDVARGFRLAAEAVVAGKAAGMTYNLATGRATNLADLATAVCTSVGVDLPIEVRPPDRASESYVADVRRIAADLGFRANVTLEEGLRRFVEWYRDAG